jgi:hypothetical protein
MRHWTGAVLLVVVAGCDATPKVVTREAPALAAIQDSDAFLRGPTCCNLIEDGWLGVTPRAYAPAQQWEKTLVAKGFVTQNAAGWIEPTSALPGRDFRLRERWVYSVRCGEPRVIELLALRPEPPELIAEFTWDWDATAACRSLEEPRIRRELTRRHRSEAWLEQCGEAWCVKRIPDFERPVVGGRYLSGVLQ